MPREHAMAERRSLLDFAIAASLAVVPVMLAVLAAVGTLRPHDATRAPPDRYVSVRHVAALETFEQAIVKRDAAPALPDAAAVLRGVPRCEREWGPSWRASRWLPAALRSGATSRAEQVASRLAEFDAALHRFSTRPNTRVAQTVGLDAARWFAATDKRLGQPIETAAYAGRRFSLRCADLLDALSALLRADARMLEALAWRGTEAGATVARWRPDQQVEVSERHVMRRNPWNGIPGCIYMGRSHFVASPGSVQARLCATPAMAGAAAATAPSALAGEPGPADAAGDDTRWMVPPSLRTLLQPLEGLRQPSHALYRLYTDADAPGYRHGPNRTVLDGSPVDVGFSVHLTIDPALQALAQKTAACYTGRHDVCRTLGLRRAEDGAAIGQRLLEGAMVRMAAVAVVDVASGRIEALAGALSPCARQTFDGPGRDPGCDRRVPYPAQYRPDALLNPAVFQDAMPASTIKPIMAAAFLSDPGAGARWLAAERKAMAKPTAPARDSLRGQLMRSDSARFLDRMFCVDTSFADCRRPWAVQSQAVAFGWNAGCIDATSGCGKHDLLFGRAVDATAEAGVIRPLATPVAYGRLMSEPPRGVGHAMRLMPPAAFDPLIVRRCAAGADGARFSEDDWEKCRGAAVVDMAAEGWGQGHARASALGVAGMMATLAAAANGQAELRRPHLVESVRGVGEPLELAVSRWGLAPPQPVRVPRDAAEVILSGLSYAHRAGTSRTACEQVFDARRCRDFDWLAGKTGTPSFPSDGVPLDELARLCRGAAVDKKPAACSSLRPHKWYVAAYRSDPAHRGPWTKAIAVLTERNWVKATGHVHGAGDHGPNPAAEIAMQIAARHVGLLPGSAP
jgi:hypothetical protein